MGSGQPSIIYPGKLEIGDIATATVLERIGHGHPASKTGDLYLDLKNLDTALDIIETIQARIKLSRLTRMKNVLLSQCTASNTAYTAAGARAQALTRTFRQPRVTTPEWARKRRGARVRDFQAGSPMHTIVRRVLLGAVAAGLILSACGPTHRIGLSLDQTRLADGVYEGYYKAGPNSAEVRVTIEHQQIVDIEILSHNAWRGRKAEPVIPERIIEAQSTAVDAVSGATNSSHVIMNAVHKAVEKASGTPSP